MPSALAAPTPSRALTYYEATEPQWLFTPADFASSTPSRVEGMSQENELLNRRKGINFITQVGISLKLDQITLATASIYFQRFYMRHPLQIAGSTKGAHHYQVAATAVYVAYKSKENPRKMHELIVAVSRVAQKDPNLLIDEQSKEFWKWRETIQHHENLMLEVLCFDLDPGLPYPVLYDFLKYFNVQENKPLRNVSWSIVNDSFSTPLCLFVQPQSIAGGAFHLALKHLQHALPDDEFGRPWWEVLGLDTAEMAIVIDTMIDTYHNPGLKGQAGAEIYLKDDEGLNFHVTRRLGTPSVEDSNTPRDFTDSQLGHDAMIDDHDTGGHGTSNGHAVSKDNRDQPMPDTKDEDQSGNASEEGELG